MCASTFQTSGQLMNMKTDTYSLFGQNDASEPVSPALAQPIRRGAGAKKTISDLHFPEAILAVKESTACRDLKELQTCLVSRLGQNSQETRAAICAFLDPLVLCGRIGRDRA